MHLQKLLHYSYVYMQCCSLSVRVSHIRLSYLKSRQILAVCCLQLCAAVEDSPRGCRVLSTVRLAGVFLGLRTLTEMGEGCCGQLPLVLGHGPQVPGDGPRVSVDGPRVSVVGPRILCEGPVVPCEGPPASGEGFLVLLEKCSLNCGCGLVSGDRAALMGNRCSGNPSCFLMIFRMVLHRIPGT